MTERPNLKLKRKLPFAAQAAGSIGLAFAAIGSLAPTCGGADNKDTGVTPQILPPAKSEDYIFPWADGEIWYLNVGPHPDVGDVGVKDALDVAPPEVVGCENNPHGVISNRFVRAMAEGTVTTVGNQNDINDPNHSIVRIKDNHGLTENYVHLTELKVYKIGEKVSQGQILGSPSCEYPAKTGSTNGIHAHISFSNSKDGAPVDITTITISGWSIQAASGVYTGTMTKAGEAKRTAKTTRCGPDAASIKSCGGIRNDLKNGQYLALAPTVAKEPTFAKVPTPPQVQIKTPEPQKTPENSLAAGWRQATEKTQKFIDLLLSGTPADLQAAFDMQMTRAQMDKYPTYYKVAEMDTIQQCSDEMHKGEFALEGLSKYVTNVQPTQTETDRINKQRGLLPPDKFAIGVAFRDRQYSIYLNGRGQFRDYIPTVDGTTLGFMDVGGGNFMISETQLCLKGPLVKLVGQPEGR